MSEGPLILFEKDKLSLSEKFYILMHILVTNRTQSYFDAYFFILLFFLQIISSFFSEGIGVLNTKETFDMILNKLYQILHVKDLLYNNPKMYKASIYIIGIYLVIFTLFYIQCLFSIKNNSIRFNSYLITLNYMIKSLSYLLLTISIDFFTSMICFRREYNPYIKEFTCNQKNNYIPFIISGISSLYIIFLSLFLQYYYEDSFYLSPSPCCKMTTSLHHFLYLNCILISTMTNLINYFHHFIYFITNFIISSSIFYYYLNRLICYDSITCIIFGIFFFEYIWTSIFFFIFYYL